MHYITGMHALNIPCPLNTSGDWHKKTLDWDNPQVADSSKSPLGTWGIYKSNLGYTANHLRAVLDIMYEGKNLHLVESFHSDYLSTREYDEEFKEKVKLLCTVPHYEQIKEIVNRNMHRLKYDIGELRASGKLLRRA